MKMPSKKKSARKSQAMLLACILFFSLFALFSFAQTDKLDYYPSDHCKDNQGTGITANWVGNDRCFGNDVGDDCFIKKLEGDGVTRTYQEGYTKYYCTNGCENDKCKGDNKKLQLSSCDAEVCKEIDGCICPKECVKTEIKDGEKCGGLIPSEFSSSDLCKTGTWSEKADFCCDTSFYTEAGRITKTVCDTCILPSGETQGFVKYWCTYGCNEDTKKCNGDGRTMALSSCTQKCEDLDGCICSSECLITGDQGDILHTGYDCGGVKPPKQSEFTVANKCDKWSNADYCCNDAVCDDCDGRVLEKYKCNYKCDIPNDRCNGDGEEGILTSCTQKCEDLNGCICPKGCLDEITPASIIHAKYLSDCGKPISSPVDECDKWRNIDFCCEFNQAVCDQCSAKSLYQRYIKEWCNYGCNPATNKCSEPTETPPPAAGSFSTRQNCGYSWISPIKRECDPKHSRIVSYCKETEGGDFYRKPEIICTNGCQGKGETARCVGDVVLKPEPYITIITSGVVPPQQNLPPVVDKIPEQQATAGEEFTLSVMAIDPDGDKIEYSFDKTLWIEQKPKGMVLFLVYRGFKLVWVPDSDDAGKSHKVGIIIKDSRGASVKRTFEITVAEGAGQADPSFTAFEYQTERKYLIGSRKPPTVGEKLKIIWDTKNVNQDGCIASSTPAYDKWIGVKGVSGIETIYPTTKGTNEFKLSCTGVNENRITEALIINVIQGQQVTPQPADVGIISVDKTSLDFGEVEVGKTKTLELKVTNTGKAPLSFDVLRAPGSQLTVDKNFFENLPPQQSVVIKVELKGTTLLKITEELQLKNKADNKIIEVTIRGEIVSVQPSTVQIPKTKAEFEAWIDLEVDASNNVVLRTPIPLGRDIDKREEYGPVGNGGLISFTDETQLRVIKSTEERFKDLWVGIYYGKLFQGDDLAAIKQKLVENLYKFHNPEQQPKPDITPPTITIKSPVGDVTIIPPATYAVVNVEVSTDEPAQCWYTDQNGYSLELAPDNNKKIHSVTISRLNVGDYAYYVTCEDDAKNSATKDFKFKIISQPTEPKLSITQISFTPEKPVAETPFKLSVTYNIEDSAVKSFGGNCIITEPAFFSKNPIHSFGFGGSAGIGEWTINSDQNFEAAGTYKGKCTINFDGSEVEKNFEFEVVAKTAPPPLTNDFPEPGEGFFNVKYFTWIRYTGTKFKTPVAVIEERGFGEGDGSDKKSAGTKKEFGPGNFGANKKGGPIEVSSDPDKLKAVNAYLGFDGNKDIDYFSMKLSGKFHFEKGDYRFWVECDDYCMLYLIDPDEHTTMIFSTSTIGVKETRETNRIQGDHIIQVEYSEGAIDAYLKFGWEKIVSQQPPAAAAKPTLNPSDFNRDGCISFNDFLELKQAYGSTQSKYDLDNSGSIDFSDFLIFKVAFESGRQACLNQMDRGIQ